MIKYNSNTINDWNYDAANIIKVYRNNAIVYYKLTTSGGTPEFKVCYAVVDDISQYQETEFVDVYDKVTDKWYKLNNLNQYEEYGVYGSGRTITYYEGKLTIDDGYEYEWNGSSWVNVGEVTGSTASLPDVPFTVNYNAKNYDASTQTFAKTNGQLADTNVIISGGTLTAHDGYVTVSSGSRGVISSYPTYFNRTNSTPNLTIISKQRTAEGNYCHMFANRDSSYNWMYRPYSNRLTLHGSSEQGVIAVTAQPVIESVRVDSNRLATYNNYTNNTTSTQSNFSYGSTNGSVALFAGYTSNTGEWFIGDFYWIYMSQTTLTDEQVQEVIDYNEGSTTSEYPKYYSEKSDPLDDLSFNTLAEAQTYAYNNCVYDGMKAIIDGDRYYFDSSDENGWVKILEYYKVEDVTPNAASGWTISGSSTYNPDSSYYDDFDLQTSSTSNSYKIAKVTIYGYDHFTYYLRTSGYSNYSYVVATNVDEIQTPPASISYNSSSAITNTYNWSKSPKSAVNLSNYRRVTYNNLDKTVEHTFYVYFYGRTYSSYVGNATILIPKEQTNENWEQVTFSASSNVASSQKSLYIDNNYSSSGGTQYWYYRWIVGLPSGSHSSHTNYSNYDYCPNVTSSTFTSVAGNSRQVNYTWNSTTNKQLTMRLVDTSGNTLTPSNTIYYTVYRYNACNYQSNQSIVITSSSYQVYFKEGGRFSLNDGSSRYYIYGYTPPTMGTTYYVDNYQSTFDIVYTKLSEEAVTITYTTYDPNDTETPAFNTEITYPYNGGTKVTTATTSYNVPYTYSYTVAQTSDMFSASNQTFTAGQASRTISFILYPNNREFATVADMEAYQYVWEGMKAIVGDTKYQYKNGVWTESSNTELEYIQCGNGTNSTNGGLQLLTNVTADYYFEVEAQCVTKSVSPMLIGEKSEVEVVSYQLGLCYYGSMFLDYGSGRLSTSIDSTTQNQRHTYGAGHISGSSYQNVVGVKLDGVVKNTINATTRVEGLPYLVGCGLRYTGHSASDVNVLTNEIDVVKLYSVKIYKDYGDTLVGDYIPVINSDDVVTLYDKVSGNYATPYGTLIAGPEKT